MVRECKSVSRKQNLLYRKCLTQNVFRSCTCCLMLWAFFFFEKFWWLWNFQSGCHHWLTFPSVKVSVTVSLLCYSLHPFEPVQCQWRKNFLIHSDFFSSLCLKVANFKENSLQCCSSTQCNFFFSSCQSPGGVQNLKSVLQVAELPKFYLLMCLCCRLSFSSNAFTS